MFGDMRLAQPTNRRCDADDALEPLNCRDAGDLCLPIAKTDLFDHIQALDGFIALEQELNEQIFLACGQAAGYTGSTRPYRLIQNRSRTSAVALKRDAAAERSKDQLPRDF